MLNLMLAVVTTGVHLGGWRHPEAWGRTAMNLDHMIEIAKLCERGKFDVFFLADQNSVIDLDNPSLFASLKPVSRPACFEPTTLLAALTRETSRIGLIATATTSYEEPYLVARRFASLDHLSGGRAGWNVVTSAYDVDALNFSRDAPLPKEERYDRAGEFVDVVFGLWDSWGDHGFPEDREAGVYADRSRVAPLDHVGEHFRVKGPLNITRPPQERPVIFHAGQSPAGRALAARAADCVFAASSGKESAIELRNDIRARAAALGRSPDAIKVIPGAAMFIGRTEEEADALFAELALLIPPELGVHYLSDMVHMDLSGYPVDGPMPELPPGDIVGMGSFRTLVDQMAKAEGLTIRQTYERLLPSLGGAVFKGTPIQIADQIEEWYRDGACDGFIVGTPIMPKSLRDFVELVVPELQRRGLFRTEYVGNTLREVMGLPTPSGRWS